MIILSVLVALCAIGFSAYSFYGWRRSATQLRQIRTRFASIVDVEDEAARARKQLADVSGDLQRAQRDHDRSIEQLRSEYQEKKAVYDKLAKEIAVFDDRLAFAEMGVYEPHFDFTDSEQYKTAIASVREKQKAMISRGEAVLSEIAWSVDGSKAKGRTMTNRGIRLTLRAFNGECDVAIANVRWNNANAMEKRLIRAQDQINKLNESNRIVVASDFLKLKIDELYLVHEHREKLRAEKEERAEAARLAREEQRLLRDMEQAQRDEEHYARLLERARSEAAGIVGPQLDAFREQISILENDLAMAHAKFERAQALAERTRSGYVYIISNAGAFGDDVMKIGLTRRLDPEDRVRELGDASVPFGFDTHAIIYSEDAPALESALHREFESTRVNLKNLRKEFFRCSIDDVEQACARLAPGTPFFRDIEAQEYRETLARRRVELDQGPDGGFPASI